LEDAFTRWVGVPATSSTAELRSALKAAEIDVGDWDWETLFTIAYAECVEPNVCSEGAAFLYEFPAKMAALARLKPGNPAVAERFELYLPGGDGAIELANAFGELVDPKEQRTRFASELGYRKSRGLAAYEMPERMLHGISELGPTSGIALGFERLLVWLAEQGPGWNTSVADWLLGEPPR
jgi:lysyl-tRNA synthetase class 2